MRIACELIEDDRFEAKKSMLDAYPNLRGMYDENDGNTQVLYMQNAVATISAFGKPSEVVKFWFLAIAKVKIAKILPFFEI